mgnify:CR=1 FL=1
MNWEAIGAIAEVLGSVAVLITLVFLVVQIKSSSAIIQNSTVQEQTSSMSEWARHLAMDGELYRIFRQGLIDETQLSREERGRFDMVLVQSFQSIGGLYRQYLNGGMDDTMWQANLRTMGATYKTPGGRASWARQKYMLDERFQREVETFFSESDS